MSKIIALDPDELNKPRREVIRGVDVEVAVAPQDVPETVGGGYDSSSRHFVIEFRYFSGDEPSVLEKQDGPVKLFVGKKTGRLYRIEIDAVRLNADEVKVSVLVRKVDEAIGRLAKVPRLRFRQGNYQVAKEVVDQVSDRLLSSDVFMAGNTQNTQARVTDSPDISMASDTQNTQAKVTD